MESEPLVSRTSEESTRQWNLCFEIYGWLCFLVIELRRTCGSTTYHLYYHYLFVVHFFSGFVAPIDSLCHEKKKKFY